MKIKNNHPKHKEPTTIISFRLSQCLGKRNSIFLPQISFQTKIPLSQCLFPLNQSVTPSSDSSNWSVSFSTIKFIASSNMVPILESTTFSRLDYTAEPPEETILAKDVHGETWKFRHIYRGAPRRHLLTTGWSNFVNKKNSWLGTRLCFSEQIIGTFVLEFDVLREGLVA